MDDVLFLIFLFSFSKRCCWMTIFWKAEKGEDFGKGRLRGSGGKEQKEVVRGLMSGYSAE